MDVAEDFSCLFCNTHVDLLFIVLVFLLDMVGIKLQGKGEMLKESVYNGDYSFLEVSYKQTQLR